MFWNLILKSVVAKLHCLKFKDGSDVVFSALVYFWMFFAFSKNFMQILNKTLCSPEM